LLLSRRAVRVCDYVCVWQPFKVLHGGVSALIAEGLASMGAHIASGYNRVAGMQLSISHFRSAAVGDTILARAVPVHIGRSTQVSSFVLSLFFYRQNSHNTTSENRTCQNTTSERTNFLQRVSSVDNPCPCI
jgi:acyl-coenzyme A thioesterase PaaI-like protein